MWYNKKDNIDEKHKPKRKVHSSKDEAINIKKPTSSIPSTEKKTSKKDYDSMKTNKSWKWTKEKYEVQLLT